MAKTKKILTSIYERRETWRVWSREKRYARCATCEIETDWLTLAEAARGTGLSEHAVVEWVEKGEIHSFDPGGGLTLVCGRSVERFAVG